MSCGRQAWSLREAALRVEGSWATLRYGVPWAAVAIVLEMSPEWWIVACQQFPEWCCSGVLQRGLASLPLPWVEKIVRLLARHCRSCRVVAVVRVVTVVRAVSCVPCRMPVVLRRVVRLS